MHCQSSENKASFFVEANKKTDLLPVISISSAPVSLGLASCKVKKPSESPLSAA
jgi:hypothetical protein